MCEASLNLLLVWVSTNLKWEEDLVDFCVPRALALRLKTAAIQQRHRWFKNKQWSPSAERFRMIPSVVNSSFASVTTLERKEESGGGERETGLRINTRLGTFVSSRLSGRSKVTRQQSASDTWFQLTAPHEHEAICGGAERRSGNVKLMSW